MMMTVTFLFCLNSIGVDVNVDNNSKMLVYRCYGGAFWGYSGGGDSISSSSRSTELFFPSSTLYMRNVMVDVNKCLR